MSHLFLFLAGYFCIYGTLQLYVLIRARRAYYLQGVRYVLIVAVLLFFIVAPLQGRMLLSQGHVWSATAVSWIGFVWMGFFGIFICLLIPLDLYHAIIGLGQRMTGADWTGLMLSRRQILGLSATLALALMVYGAIEAHQVTVRTVTVTSKKLPPETKRFRMVQLSDLHLGIMTYPGRLTPVFEAIEMAKPDVIVSTGDLIDGFIFRQAAIASKFASLPATQGKFAVLGNHESYLDAESVHGFFNSAGFSLLSHATTAISPHISFAGVDDPAFRRNASSSLLAETALLEKIPSEHFRILLKHRPAIHSASKGKFDLQLSGHTHAGQIFPFNLLVLLRYPMGQGLKPVIGGGHIYISSGAGTWGPPIRLLAPPEITIIDIIRKP